MTLYKNECVDCGLPCIGYACPNRSVKRTYCDECGEATDTVEIYGSDLCEECAKCFLQGDEYKDADRF